ncbi:MAG TPA: MlaD family protein, partial [Vicinamibacterales bacterium]|nr:MlaD family protein [Vicinamibacterales bacterium]
MAVEKSYARLGLFLVITLVVVLATALLFIQRLRSHSVIAMVTYTTGNVSGLDISSPVRYRGVHIGQVTDVRVDPRGNLVEIDFEVFLDRLNTLGMDVKRIQKITDIGGMLPRLRAQVVGNPVTGEAYLLLDSPQNPPPAMTLGFTPTLPYVPSMPSIFSTVQDRLPELIDRAETTLNTVAAIVSRIPDSLDKSDRFFTNVERIVQESNIPALSADSRKFLSTTSVQLDRISSDLNKQIGPDGTFSKAVDDARAAINGAELPATTR